MYVIIQHLMYNIQYFNSQKLLIIFNNTHTEKVNLFEDVCSRNDVLLKVDLLTQSPSVNRTNLLDEKKDSFQTGNHFSIALSSFGYIYCLFFWFVCLNWIPRQMRSHSGPARSRLFGAPAVRRPGRRCTTVGAQSCARVRDVHFTIT